jgi:hypothetical protein
MNQMGIILVIFYMLIVYDFTEIYPLSKIIFVTVIIY